MQAAQSAKTIKTCVRFRPNCSRLVVSFSEPKGPASFKLITQTWQLQAPLVRPAYLFWLPHCRRQIGHCVTASLLVRRVTKRPG